MNELSLSVNLKAHLLVFEEKLQILRCVGILEDEARTKSEQEATNKYPLMEEDKALIKDIFREQVLQKHRCKTTLELEEKRQDLRREAEEMWKASKTARENNDHEGSQKFAIQMDKSEAQVQEIEHTLDADLINGNIVLAVLNLVKPNAH